MVKSLTIWLMFMAFGLGIGSQMTQAGVFGSLVRKAAREASDAPGSLGRKLDFDSLKHFDVEPGVSRVGLSARSDGTVLLKTAGGEELLIRSADDVEKALSNLSKKLKKRDGSAGGKARFFVSKDHLFGAPKASLILSKMKGLQLITGKKTSLPVLRISDEVGRKVWAVQVRKGILAVTPDAKSLKEAVWRMGHAFNSADIHVVSFSRKAQGIPSAMPFTRGGRVPEPTLISPQQLETAFKALRGKKLVVTGKVEGDVLLVKAGAQKVQRLSIADMRAKASAANVDLIVLGGKKATQPGKKSLFGRADDKRLATAFDTHTYGDFLAALGGRKSPMVVHGNAVGQNHMIWRSVPTARAHAPTLRERMGEETIGGAIVRFGVQRATLSAAKNQSRTDDASSVSAESEVTVELSAKNERWQEELERRIIPGIPFYLQVMYVINIVCGLLAWSVSNWLWDKIWRRGAREAFHSAWKWHGYRLFRTLGLVLGLMGGLGLFLFVIHGAIQIWETARLVFFILTWPFRKVYQLVRRFAA